MPWKKTVQLSKKTHQKQEQVAEAVRGTPQQELIWKAMVETDCHLIVEALAGTGKTFTLVEGLKKMQRTIRESGERAVFCAFNKTIAQELKRKVPVYAEACTLNSFGFAAVRAAMPDVEMEENKLSRIVEELIGEGKSWGEFTYSERSMAQVVEKLVRLVKSTMSGSLVLEEGREVYSIGAKELSELADKYSVEIEAEDEEEVHQLVCGAVLESALQRDTIDFDDQLWFPVVWKLPVNAVGTMLVDESQDLNRCQQELILRVAKRVILVGDPNQAIYGFRGADNKSIGRMREMLEKRDVSKSVKVFPLTMTRRCPKKHVELAAKIVPTFEAMPEAAEGTIAVQKRESILDQAKHGDMILCRRNGPLVSAAFGLIRKNKRPTIQGRDFGKGLTTLVSKLMRKRGGTVAELSVRLTDYEVKQVAKLTASRQEKKLESLRDKIGCLRYFCEDAGDEESVEDAVVCRINSIFGECDKAPAERILLSSVHRAKRMEAERVAILEPWTMPLKHARTPEDVQQEMNCKYVALTRSKLELILESEPECGSGESLS